MPIVFRLNCKNRALALACVLALTGSCAASELLTSPVGDLEAVACDDYAKNKNGVNDWGLYFSRAFTNRHEEWTDRLKGVTNSADLESIFAKPLPTNWLLSTKHPPGLNVMVAKKIKLTPWNWRDYLVTSNNVLNVNRVVSFLTNGTEAATYLSNKLSKDTRNAIQGLIKLSDASPLAISTNIIGSTDTSPSDNDKLQQQKAYTAILKMNFAKDLNNLITATNSYLWNVGELIHYWTNISNVISLNIRDTCPSECARIYKNRAILEQTLFDCVSTATTSIPSSEEDKVAHVWVQIEPGDETQWLFFDSLYPPWSLNGHESLVREHIKEHYTLTENETAKLYVKWGDLGTPFTDGFVIQRGQPAHIWGSGRFPMTIVGRTDPVNVSQHDIVFANYSTEKNRSLFKWDCCASSVSTNLMGKMLTLEFRAGTKTSAPLAGWLSNVVVGDVWLLAGGHNIRGAELTLTNSQIITNDLRMMILNRVSAKIPQSTVGVRSNGWILAGPHAIANSVVPKIPWVLGKLLSDASNGAPVGLVLASVGATELDAWIPGNGTNFNGMLAPLRGPTAQSRLAMTGVILSHGEWPASQSDDFAVGTLYLSKLKNLINSWRKEIVPLTTPFLVAQVHRPTAVLFDHTILDSWLSVQCAQYEAAATLDKVYLAPLWPVKLRGLNDSNSADSIAACLMNRCQSLVTITNLSKNTMILKFSVPISSSQIYASGLTRSFVGVSDSQANSAECAKSVVASGSDSLTLSFDKEVKSVYHVGRVDDAGGGLMDTNGCAIPVFRISLE